MDADTIIQAGPEIILQHEMQQQEMCLARCELCQKEYRDRKHKPSVSAYQTTLINILGRGNFQYICSSCVNLVSMIHQLQTQLTASIKQLKNIYTTSLGQFGDVLEETTTTIVTTGPELSPKKRGRKPKPKPLTQEVVEQQVVEEGFSEVHFDQTGFVVEEYVDAGGLPQIHLLENPPPATAAVVQSPLKKKKKPNSDFGSLDCYICGQHFSTAAECRNHRRSHTGDKPFKCDLCGANFNQRQSLRSHLKNKHQQNQDKRFPCEHCKKKFLRQRLLDSHMNSKHYGIRPYQCPNCQARFVGMDGLQKHQKKLCKNTAAQTKENRDGRYPCDSCDQRFRLKKFLDAHMSSKHPFDRPHKCDKCPATFVYLDGLNTHISRGCQPTNSPIRTPKKTKAERQYIPRSLEGPIRSRHQIYTTNTALMDMRNQGEEIEMVEEEVVTTNVVLKDGIDYEVQSAVFSIV